MTCKQPLWLKLGILLPAISLACGIVVYAFPGAATVLLEHLTHSRWQYEILPFDATQFVTGLALWAAIGGLAGWGYSKLCSCCGARQDGRRK